MMISKPSAFKIVTVIVLAVGCGFTIIYVRDVDVIFSAGIPDVVAIANEMNINNLVTTIYLGPRIFDTFLEVMVLLLTVYGVMFVRGTRKDSGDEPL